MPLSRWVFSVRPASWLCHHSKPSSIPVFVFAKVSLMADKDSSQNRRDCSMHVCNFYLGLRSPIFPAQALMPVHHTMALKVCALVDQSQVAKVFSQKAVIPCGHTSAIAPLMPYFLRSSVQTISRNTNLSAFGTAPADSSATKPLKFLSGTLGQKGYSIDMLSQKNLVARPSAVSFVFAGSTRR